MLKPLLLVLLFSCLSCSFVAALMEIIETKINRIERIGSNNDFNHHLRGDLRYRLSRSTLSSAYRTETTAKVMVLRGGYTADMVTWQGMFLTMIIFLITHTIPKISIPVVVFLSCFGGKLLSLIYDQLESRNGCLRLLATCQSLILLALLSTGKLASANSLTKYLFFAFTSTAIPFWLIQSMNFVSQEEETIQSEVDKGHPVVWKSVIALLLGAMGSAASLHSSAYQAPAISKPLNAERSLIVPVEPYLYGPPLGEVYGASRESPPILPAPEQKPSIPKIFKKASIEPILYGPLIGEVYGTFRDDKAAPQRF
jgi:hypothetical protein